MKAQTIKKIYPFTLSDISDLLDNKLAIWSDRIRSELKIKIDQSTTGIIAEMDKRFATVDERFDDVDKRFAQVDKRFDKIDERFNDNDNAHQEIISAIEEISERKIKQHSNEKHSFVAA